MDSIVAITCDGCNNNTGKHGGVIKSVELELDVHYNVSLSFASDRVTIERDVQNIDSVTRKLRKYQGEIRKKLDRSQDVTSSKIS